MEKIKCGIIGDGDRFTKCVNALGSLCDTIVLGPTSKEFDLSASQIRTSDFKSFLKMVNDEKCKYVFCVGYGKYIDSSVFRLGYGNWINLHASLIPKYRGGSPLNWAIINGDDYAGLTMLEMTAGLDTGPIILQEKVYIQDLNYTEVTRLINDLAGKMVNQFLLGHEELWDRRRNQDLTLGSHYTTRTPRDSVLDFNTLSDVEIFRRFRALPDPLPRPFCYYNGQKIELVEIDIADIDVFGPSGRIAGFVQGKFFIIAANRGIIVEKICVDGVLIEPSAIFKTGDDLDDN